MNGVWNDHHSNKDGPRVSAAILSGRPKRRIGCWNSYLLLQFEFTRSDTTLEFTKCARRVVGIVHEASAVMLLGKKSGWKHAVAWLSDQQISMTTANAAQLESEGESWR